MLLFTFRFHSNQPKTWCIWVGFPAFNASFPLSLILQSKKVKFHGNRFTKKKQNCATKTAETTVSDSVQLPGVHDSIGTSSATSTSGATYSCMEELK